MDEEFGFNRGLSIWDKLRIIQEWAPLVTYIRAFSVESDAHRQSLIIADACEWLASKTETRLDDEFVSHLAAVLRSPQGESFVRWIVKKVQA
jgi:hypothetical protein